LGPERPATARSPASTVSSDDLRVNDQKIAFDAHEQPDGRTTATATVSALARRSTGSPLAATATFEPDRASPATTAAARSADAARRTCRPGIGSDLDASLATVTSIATEGYISAGTLLTVGVEAPACATLADTIPTVSSECRSAVATIQPRPALASGGFVRVVPIDPVLGRGST
jgi:hypothetical protein